MRLLQLHAGRSGQAREGHDDAEASCAEGWLEGHQTTMVTAMAMQCGLAEVKSAEDKCQGS